MEARQAEHDDINVGARLIYIKDANRCTTHLVVTILGFVPLYLEDNEEYTLSAIRLPDGQIVLAEDEQLFMPLCH